MIFLKASKTRIPTDVFNRVVYNGDIVEVKRRGGKSVYIVSKDLFESMEDQIDINEAIKRLTAAKKGKENPMSLSEVKRRLNL